MKHMKAFFILLLCAFFVSCASDEDVNLEKAKFALDEGHWNDVISYAQSVLDEDPANVEAALLISSAYAGRGGFRLLELLDVVADDLRRRDIFDAMQDSLFLIAEIDPADLRLAIESIAINPEPFWGHVKFVDYNFQMGLLQIIEAYAKSSLAVQFGADLPIDVDAITEEIKDIIIADLIGFDDRLVAAGVAEDDPMIKNTRATYCVLQNASVGSSGVDLSALRDMLKCQLSPNDGAELIETDFESATIKSCADFDFDACQTVGDTEL